MFIMKTIFRMKALLAAVLAFGLLFTSCKKDDDPTPTELLTEKAWKLTAQVVSPPLPTENGTLVTDLYAQYAACVKDDLATFRDNGTVLFDEGASKCVSTDPQTVTGIWAFNTTETVLSITLDGETTSYDIVNLEDKKMVVDEEFTDFDGITYTITSTYSRQ